MTVRRVGRWVSWTVVLAFFTSLTACSGGEESTPPTTLVVPTTVPTTPSLPAQPPERLSKDQLRELVAPVALYPDVVLASLLPATTYPEQIDDAARWLAQQNGQVRAVPEDRNWDGSVSGLLQFPDVLAWLDQNDPWTQQMGTAMTYQQGDVLEAIQDYRKLALDAGNLKSNQYMEVSARPNQDIHIAPAQPDTVYVPQYDPVAVTQPQQQTGINPWLAFGGGAVVGALGAWALYSIFDDDDHDGGHHHGGHNKKVKQYNNYYYGGGQRPPGGAWNPRPRPGRPGRPGQIARPTPVQSPYARKPGKRPGGGGGVRPPHARPGQPAPGTVARPATPPPVPGAGKEAKGGGGKKQGGGKKKGDKRGGGQNVQQTETPAPAPATQKKKQQQKQGGDKKKKKKKQGGGSN